MLQNVSVRDIIRKRAAAGDLAEVGVLDLQRHRSTENVGALAASPDLVDDRLEFGPHLVEAEKVTREGVLRPNRLADAVGVDRAVIDPSGDCVEVRAGLAKVPFEDGE